jgi:mannose-6-phosphate isomerase class I
MEDQVFGGDPSRSLKLLNSSWGQPSGRGFEEHALAETWAGQHPRFKAFVATGNYNSHIRLGVSAPRR